MAEQLMKLLDAAAFLSLHPNTVRSYAASGRLPGAKVGRDWRFIRSDLEEWLRSGYKAAATPVSPSATQQEDVWHSTNGMVSGTSRSQAQTENLLDTLLGQPTGNAPRNTTTG